MGVFMLNIPQVEAQRFSMEDRVVVITGCTGVLGSAYCRALAQRGARLLIADLSDRDPIACAAALAIETGAEVFGVECDVGSEKDVVALFTSSLERFGRVDVVLNNAAATGEHLIKLGDVFASFENYPLAVWQKVLQTNLTGVFLVAREGGKAMLQSGGGSLINVSSIYAVAAPDHRIYEGMPFSSFPAYSAGKAGVHGLTLWLSSYWGRKGIRVNTLVPGGVFNKHQDEFVRRYSDRTPMGRMANTDDLVGMVIFLASDASSYCTGQQYIVDGGLTAW
jgi:NAD(P)-dependent dehydrogenase (short-subunit alcohol dehydrogenase family)